MAFVQGIVDLRVRGRAMAYERRVARLAGGERRMRVRAAVEVETHVPSETVKRFVDVTPNAVKQLMNLKQSNGKDCLRVGVRQGGCSGMSYFMEFEDNVNVDEKFDETTEVEGMTIVCDMKSLMYMFGMTLDFSDDLIGGGFKFFNPKATSTCGCGQSFGV